MAARDTWRLKFELETSRRLRQWTDWPSTLRHGQYESFSGCCCSYLRFRLISCLKWLIPCGYSRFVSLWWLHENVL